MSDVTQDQVVDYVKGVSVLELSELVKKLEEELGVTAAAAMPVVRARTPTPQPPCGADSRPTSEPVS